MKRLLRLMLLVAVLLLSAISGLMLGWKYIASDACHDAGGMWRNAGNVCLGLKSEP
jgi:hypothetical protein